MGMVKCPRCHSRMVIKKGKRRARYRVKQVYQCKQCGRRFTPRRDFKHKSYPGKVIVHALNYYHQGYTLAAVSRLINQRFKVKTSKSTIYNWVAEFSDVCSFHKIRDAVAKEFGPEEVICSTVFRHQGLDYVFRCHQGKLQRVASVFPAVVGYVKRFEDGCPDYVFEDGMRCSKMKVDVDVEERDPWRNQACQLAGLALHAADENYMRHQVVEDFMLINDVATVACELPVWFWDKNVDVGVSGHIDVVQIRKNRVYVMDYKPRAAREKTGDVVSQLYLYARGLSFRTGKKLQCFRCAWFDEHHYYEFNPAAVTRA